MRGNVIFYLSLFSILSACSSSQTVLSIRKTDKVSVIALPLDLDSKYAIRTEEFFDNHFNDLKDTLSLDNLKFSIKERELLEDYSRIDMRAKVLITSANSRLKTFYLSHTGLLMYQDKIYQAPKELMKLVRSFDSLRSDKGLYY